MQNPEEELKKYRRQIYKDGVFLMNTRFRFLKEFTDNNNRVIWENPLGGLSSIFYDSLFDNLIVTLSWLYSESKQDKRSLIWYLNQIKANTKKFSDEEIDEQLGKINEVKNIIEKIHIVRSKWIVHRDPIAFNNPKDFLESNEVSLQDFETLIKLAQEIINEHFGRFEDTEVDFDLPVIGIDGLVWGEKARRDLLYFIEEIDLSGGKADSEERKNKAIESLLGKQNKN